MIKNNHEFVKIAKHIATNYKTLYVNGAWGHPLNAQNKAEFVHGRYSYNRSHAAQINAASTDTFGFDCVCLIKGILWGWSGNKNLKAGGAAYGSNGVPDIDEAQMIAVCKNVSSDFRNVIPGEMLFMNGHAGIYIGDGLGVECTPSWKNGVQITAVGNMGAKAGYNTRTWQKHGILPYFAYGAVQPTSTVDPLAGLTDEELANMVILGRFGNGNARKQSLHGRYAAVQAIVEKMLKGDSLGEEVHVVQPGDNLTAIAKKYGTTVEKIVAANGIKNANLIYAGQRLTIKR